VHLATIWAMPLPFIMNIAGWMLTGADASCGSSWPSSTWS
jgi:hypothetical protein